MDWNVPLSAMGGKTGEQLAQEAFLLHVTQQRQAMSSPTRTRQATPNFRSSIRPSGGYRRRGFL